MRSIAWATVLIGLSFADSATSSEPTHRLFGHLADGKPVQVYSWRTDALEVSITNFGGRILRLRTPDREGHFDDIVLGFQAQAEADRFLVKHGLLKGASPLAPPATGEKLDKAP